MKTNSEIRNAGNEYYYYVDNLRVWVLFNLFFYVNHYCNIFFKNDLKKIFERQLAFLWV